MGGMGSGQHWCCGAKDSTNDYRSIDVRRWKRDGLLAPHQSFGWQWSRHGEVVASIQVRTELDRVILTYRHRSGGEDWKGENYPVYLDWTACNLGVQRPWFLCPARGCGRRVAILYGGRIFACRHCYQLAYPSQRETWDDRAARRADRIRDKLGWEPGILNDNGWKPKGMHWNTFERLTAQHDTFVQISLAGMVAKLNLPEPSLNVTEDQRKEIQRLSGLGVPIREIAAIVGISVPTIYKYYREDLITGNALDNSEVVSALYDAAMKGNVKAQIYWTKRRCGWKEGGEIFDDMDNQSKGQIQVMTNTLIPAGDSRDEHRSPLRGAGGGTEPVES